MGLKHSLPGGIFVKKCVITRCGDQGFYAWTLTTTVVSDYTQTPRLLANNAMYVRRQLKVTDNSRD